MIDVIIIGAGVTGAFIGRELSKYKLNILVIEKCNDVGNVTSSANSAIVHSGYDPLPGTLKAKLNVKGCKMYKKICEELDVEYTQCGTLTVMDSPSQKELFDSLIKRSQENGVFIKTLNKEELHKLEPNINPNCLGAIYAPEAGIINPLWH